MIIVEREPASWALFAFRGEYYLDIRCEVVSYGIGLLIKLSNVEQESYFEDGKRYVMRLAAEIRSLPQRYYSRNEPIEIQMLVGQAMGEPLGNANLKERVAAA